MDIRIILFGLWVATMLVFLLGDVLRIFAGDYEKGTMSGQKVGPNVFTVAAAMMVIPIIVALLNLMLEASVAKWANILTAGFFFALNLLGLRGYKLYDQFLLVVSLVFNVLVIWYSVN